MIYEASKDSKREAESFVSDWMVFIIRENTEVTLFTGMKKLRKFTQIWRIM
jgi:hypothetical protein